MADEHVPEYLKTHVLRGEHLLFHLPERVAELRQELTGDRERRGVTLLKQDGLNVVLTAIRAGGRVAEHGVAGPALLQAVTGRVRLRAGTETWELGPGDLAALGPGVAHDLEALEDAAVLVVIAAPSSA